MSQELEPLDVEEQPDLHDLFSRPARPREREDDLVYADVTRGIPRTDDPETWTEYDPIVVEANQEAGRKHERFAGYSWSSPLGPTDLIDALRDEDLLEDASVFISKPSAETIEAYCEQEGLREGYHLLGDSEGRKRPHFEDRSTPGFFYSDTPDSYWTDLDGALGDRDFLALYREESERGDVDDAVGFKLDIGERNGLRIAVDWKYDDGARVHLAAHEHQPAYLDTLYEATEGPDLKNDPSALLSPDGDG